MAPTPVCSRARRARRFYTSHAFITQSPELGRTARTPTRPIERLLARRTEGMILVSEPEATHARIARLRPKTSTTNPKRNRLSTAPHRAEARRSFDLPRTVSSSAVSEGSAPQKGVDLLLDVTPRLLARCPDARLAIVGEGEAGSALRAQAKRLGIDDHVTWLGQRDGQRSMPAFDVAGDAEQVRRVSLRAARVAVGERSGSRDGGVQRSPGAWRRRCRTDRATHRRSVRGRSSSRCRSIGRNSTEWDHGPGNASPRSLLDAMVERAIEFHVRCPDRRRRFALVATDVLRGGGL